MEAETFLVLLLVLLIALLIWPVLYIFAKKGSKKLKFALISWLITITASILSQFVLLPLYLFAIKIGPQLVEDGINTLNWLFMVLDQVSDWSFLIVFILTSIWTPALLYKGRGEYHLSSRVKCDNNC